MTDQYSINQLFPTTVLYRDRPDLVTTEICELCRDLVAQHSQTPFYSACHSTVYTQNQVLELPEFRMIRDFLRDLVAVYLDVLRIDGSRLGFLDSWVNLYDIGGYQDLHMHHDSMISGVFWISSDGSKDFVIQAPWHFQQPRIPRYTQLDLSNSHNVEYNSVPGRGLLFLSHALHRTLPAQQQRISLSFNVG